MRQTVIINGYETDIEIMDNQSPYPTASGNEDTYSIDYGNGVVEFGGSVVIGLNSETDGLTEGKAVVQLKQPFSNWLSTQVTVNDVPNRVGERANIVKKDNQSFEVWASVNGSELAQIKVNWSVKGVI